MGYPGFHSYGVCFQTRKPLAQGGPDRNDLDQSSDLPRDLSRKRKGAKQSQNAVKQNRRRLPLVHAPTDLSSYPVQRESGDRFWKAPSTLELLPIPVTVRGMPSDGYTRASFQPQPGQSRRNSHSAAPFPGRPRLCPQKSASTNFPRPHRGKQATPDPVCRTPSELWETLPPSLRSNSVNISAHAFRSGP